MSISPREVQYRALERNLRLYPIYVALRSLLFWIPIFFLYFSQGLSIDRVLLLESIYYGANVLLEVPSGYFSDRVGRRPTLLIAGAAFVSGYAIFAFATGFVPYAIAQVLVAIGFAFTSGTDSSLLYDSLLAVGREEEIARREAHARRGGYLAHGLAALMGGLVAGVDLRAAYVLSMVGAAAALAVTAFFREPERLAEPEVGPGVGELRQIVGNLRQPILLWIFLFAVAMTVFEHVPYMFFQPYLDLLFGESEGYTTTPLVSGGLVAAMMMLSAGASSMSIGLRDRIGVAPALLLSLGMYVLITAAMARWLHPMVIVAIALRSVPQAVAGPIVSGVIHPRISSATRASYLSVQSLAGRLTFSGSLALAATAVGRLETLHHPEMALLLWAFASVNVAALLLLVLTSRTQRSVADQR